MVNAERDRLDEADTRGVSWRRWGPYLSERQWGTVREDYSGDGEAWSSFTHDQARSRAYRWGEDGLAGVSDDRQRLCLALTLWNGRDPILKKRLFGLTNAEGNHGEDVKECYFHLDATPTSSYLPVHDATEFLARHPAVTAALWGHGQQARATGPLLFALFDETRLRRILARMLDEEELLGPHGIRSVSRWHAEHPYVIKVGGQEYSVGYRPAESDAVCSAATPTGVGRCGSRST